MSYFSKPSMHPGAGTTLNMQWLLPAAAGLSNSQQRMFANSQSGDPGTIYDLMNLSKGVNNFAQQYDGNPASSGSTLNQASTLSLLSNPADFAAKGRTFPSTQLKQNRLGVAPQVAINPSGEDGAYEKQLGIHPDSPIRRRRQQLKDQYGGMVDTQIPEMFRAAVPFNSNPQLQLANNYSDLDRQAIRFLAGHGITDPMQVQQYIKSVRSSYES